MLFYAAAGLAVLAYTASLSLSYSVLPDFSVGRLKLRNLVDGWCELLKLIIPFIDPFKLRLPVWLALPAGLLLYAVGMAFTLLALRSLMPVLAARSRGQPHPKLLKTGVYSVVRHPLYFGSTLWPAGLSIALRAAASLALTPVWLTYYTIIANIEEKQLTKEFGEEYEEYKRKVKKIIPLVY